jgi:hypothetical protein
MQKQLLSVYRARDNPFRKDVPLKALEPLFRVLPLIYRLDPRWVQ